MSIPAAAPSRTASMGGLGMTLPSTFGSKGVRPSSGLAVAGLDMRASISSRRSTGKARMATGSSGETPADSSANAAIRSARSAGCTVWQAPLCRIPRCRSPLAAGMASSIPMLMAPAD